MQEIDFLGMLLSFLAFYLGIRFPDWDFKLRLRHRSILTHSPLLSLLMIYLYYHRMEEALFAYLIAGFAFGNMIHMIFDIFPHGWGSGALLKIPVGRLTCSPEMTKYFFLFCILLDCFMVVIFLGSWEEYLLYFVFGFFFIVSKIPKEKKFWRPIALYFAFLLLGSLNFIDIGLK